MAQARRRFGWMTWTAIIAAVLVLAGIGLWRWAAANDSVATLDAVDGLFTKGDAEVVAGPVAIGDGDEQVLYVMRASGDEIDRKMPVLVWIHGGAWRDGDPKDYAFMGRNFAPEGFVVVNAGYRKGAGGGEYPAMLEDGAAALRWVVDNIANYGGDAERIYLMGHSAGAYNAVMLGLDRQWLGREGLPDDTIDGVVGLAGPYDFLPLDKESTIRTFGAQENLDATQPVNFVRADAPPMLLVHGSEDEVVNPRHSKALEAAQRAVGGEALSIELEGLNHADLVMRLARPFSRETRTKDAVLGWLQARVTAEDVPEPSPAVQPPAR